VIEEVETLVGWMRTRGRGEEVCDFDEYSNEVRETFVIAEEGREGRGRTSLAEAGSIWLGWRSRQSVPWEGGASLG